LLRELIAGALAALFLLAALQKAARPRASSAALATYSVPERTRTTVLIAVIGVELALAAGLAAGLSLAAWAGGALALAFAALAARSLARASARARGSRAGPSGATWRWPARWRPPRSSRAPSSTFKPGWRSAWAWPWPGCSRWASP
jgi:hypothetical protein